MLCKTKNQVIAFPLCPRTATVEALMGINRFVYTFIISESNIYLDIRIFLVDRISFLVFKQKRKMGQLANISFQF